MNDSSAWLLIEWAGTLSPSPQSPEHKLAPNDTTSAGWKFPTGVASVSSWTVPTNWTMDLMDNKQLAKPTKKIKIMLRFGFDMSSLIDANQETKVSFIATWSFDYGWQQRWKIDLNVTSCLLLESAKESWNTRQMEVAYVSVVPRWD